MVSVCMATYNGERYLREQIDSILAQLEPEDELIVSDDGSVDATLSILDSYSDPRVKVYHNEGRHGVNANFENAMSHTNGDYIFLSDQDDVWLPGKVRKCVATLTESDLVLHNATIVDTDLRPLGKSLFDELHPQGGVLRNLMRNEFTGCCMAFRKDVLKYVTPFPKTVPFYHDSWIGLLVGLKGKINILSDELLLFRRHMHNNSSAGTQSKNGLSKKILIRLSLVYNLTKRLCRR